MKAYLALLMLPLAIGLALLLDSGLSGVYTPPPLPSLKPLTLPSGLDLVQPRPPTTVANLEMDAFAGLEPAATPKTSARRTAPQAVVLKLTALVTLDDTRLANINGQLLSEGDHVAGYTVIRITDTEVTLQGPGGRRRLTMD